MNTSWSPSDAAPDEAPLIGASGLRWSPPEGPPILAGVDMDLAPGNCLWLSGPSGGGKSTLLRVLNRLITPDTGEVAFLGRPLASWPAADLRRRVVLVPQTPALPAATVKANLTLPFSFAAARNQPAPGDADLLEACRRLGLDPPGLADKTERLSVGQKQRLCLLRGLLLEPRVLLLDEPLAPLDPASVALVEAELGRFLERGGGVVMVSHQQPGLACRRLELVGGRLREKP